MGRSTNETHQQCRHCPFSAVVAPGPATHPAEVRRSARRLRSLLWVLWQNGSGTVRPQKIGTGEARSRAPANLCNGTGGRTQHCTGGQDTARQAPLQPGRRCVRRQSSPPLSVQLRPPRTDTGHLRRRSPTPGQNHRRPQRPLHHGHLQSVGANGHPLHLVPGPGYTHRWVDTDAARKDPLRTWRCPKHAHLQPVPGYPAQGHQRPVPKVGGRVVHPLPPHWCRRPAPAKHRVPQRRNRTHRFLLHVWA